MDLTTKCKLRLQKYMSVKAIHQRRISFTYNVNKSSQVPEFKSKFEPR